MKRERITILVEVDTDPVPGWGNDPEDYVKHVQRLLDQTIPHYNPVAKLSQAHENFTNPMDPLEHVNEANRQVYPQARGIWRRPS